MTRFLPVFLLGCFYFQLSAQTDSLPVPVKKMTLFQKVTQSRQELLNAFLNNDPAGAALWRDSLIRMENVNQSTLMWDERWLLYFWEESYGNLFEEAAQFDENTRYLSEMKIAPPQDSLFEWLDFNLYENRFDYFQHINRGFLSQEEKAFATILFEYLLRLNANKADWNNRVDAFKTKYPSSRFNTFLQTTATPIIKAGPSAFDVDVLFHSGTFRDQLERSLEHLWAVDFGLNYWKNRWNIGIHATIGGPKLKRDVYENIYLWPKGDPTTFIAPELEFGYDIFNSKKLRIFPALGAGFTFLRAPTPDEGEDPLPEYYTLFSYSSGHLMANLTTDIKFMFNEEDDVPQGSYHGLRVRVGYRKMYLGNDNFAFSGDMFFMAIGYNLFLYSPKN
jgi:hypothetical protein